MTKMFYSQTTFSKGPVLKIIPPTKTTATTTTTVFSLFSHFFQNYTRLGKNIFMSHF